MATAPIHCRLITLLLVATLAQGCLPQGRPLVTERSPDFSGTVPGEYIVRGGDSLYSIAWRYALDHRQLAALNAVPAPYTIYPGQRLRLRGTTRTPNPTIRPEPKPATKPAVKSPPRTVASAETRSGSWIWPLQLKPHKEFGAGSKGMDFVVAPRDGGQVAMQVAIRAAASGEVVYAGSGIGGYERLIIVKHTPELLSAYSFNGEIRVAERDRLNAGAPLAQMRSALRKPEKLHFELRRQGVPVNPRNVLK